MKAIPDVIDFFNTFPSGEFDVESVTAALKGYGSCATVRRALKALVDSGYLKWRWGETNRQAKRLYSLQLCTDANGCHEQLAAKMKKAIISSGLVSLE